MKSEILSYLPETTTSFTFNRVESRIETTYKARKRTQFLLFVLFATLYFTSTCFISNVQASWLSEKFSFLTPPQQSTEKDTPGSSNVALASEEIAPITVSKISQADTFQDNIKDIAKQLFTHLDDNDPQTGYLADGVAFTVFADLKKLTRTSSFGRYLSEQLMSEFQQQGFPVIEVRKSNSIMVMQKRGEYGLSRDLDEIGNSAQARTMLTGTYTVAGDHIMVNAKILDNANSSLLSSATVLFEKNALTDALLADSASAYPRKDAYVYMKKLQL